MSELKELYDKNPDKRVHTFQELTIKIESKTGWRYLLPKWISGLDEDKYYHSGNFTQKLRLYNVTPQEYYDVLILNIDDESLRPKCPCGKYTDFVNIAYGYKSYCNAKCVGQYFMKGRKQSPETLRKRSEGMKGKRNSLGTVFSDEARLKLSMKKKGKPHTPEWNKNLSISAKNRYLRMPELMPSYGDTLRGTYTPIKSNGVELKHHSSWELDFMKMADDIDEIVLIERHKVIIPYHDPIADKDRHYDPDFKVTLNSGDIVIVEIKPMNRLKDPVVQSKKDAAIEYVKSINNCRYVILTENELYGSNRKPLIEYLTEKSSSTTK